MFIIQLIILHNFLQFQYRYLCTKFAHLILHVLSTGRYYRVRYDCSPVSIWMVSISPTTSMRAPTIPATIPAVAVGTRPSPTENIQFRVKEPLKALLKIYIYFLISEAGECSAVFA